MCVYIYIYTTVAVVQQLTQQSTQAQCVRWLHNKLVYTFHVWEPKVVFWHNKANTCRVRVHITWRCFYSGKTKKKKVPRRVEAAVVLRNAKRARLELKGGRGRGGAHS